MKKNLFIFGMIIFTSATIAQSAHILQGAGSVNWSMGGAATGQPIDISGALQWNPAAISVFDGTIVNLDIGIFSSSPELFSTVPEVDSDGMPTGNFITGNTEDDRPLIPLPSLAIVFGKSDSKHKFGASIFGISGAGVDFPESTTNPINFPQSLGGFGGVKSEYAIIQLGLTYAYKVSENFSIGIKPAYNLSTLELAPNPTAPPTSAGYPSTDTATATGLNAQIGLFYDTQTGFKAGVSYSTKIKFDDFELENTYLDGSTSTNNFNIEYPAIFSVGLGYSKNDFDLALDYRHVAFKNTEGLAPVGWNQDGTVKGFGWQNISIISAGIQYKGIDRLPLRLGYTYNNNPIEDRFASFNVSAAAIIQNAFQFGLSYLVNSQLELRGVFHYGTSSGKTSGEIFSPAFIQDNPPFGAIPGSNVSYDMTTSMLMMGLSYKFRKQNSQ
ncbi:OmpP1/FadL family transporter [Winogradskyella ursingii]|uniref:OmpP1/FadL family transporter n=1 Tax=Winogradskyella ursingii TaxID=2686079 RepID=UPI0015C87282|nr:outer membrane protein transport protein [Winogradskyella ursingii]